jgi:hypothetical protein
MSVAGGMLSHMDGQPIDLTSAEVTSRLLRNPRDWRERAVEGLRVGSARFVHRERSLQCRPLFHLVSDLVAPGARPSSTGFVVLPLALMPKQPLISFEVSGPGSPPVLLRRPDIADREARLIQAYAAEAGLHLGDDVLDALPVLLGFTEGSWAAVKAAAGRGGDAFTTYLQEGLSQPLQEEQLTRLRAASDRAHAALSPFSESPADVTSAAESPFLIVPVLVEGGYVPDADRAIQIVVDYVDLLERAVERAAVQEPSAAGDLLSVLADYGRHWELMVLCEVPLDRPFTVTYRHLDPVRVRGWHHTIAPAVVIADADSNHVAISIEDPGTRLVSVVALHPRTGSFARMGSTSRRSDEMHAFYVWEVDVDFRVVLSARLGVLRRVALANILLAVIVLLVATALLLRPPATSGELAVVAGPTAAAASLLLLREPSTLASRLRLPYSVTVAAAVLVLVAVTIWRFVTLP